MLKSLSIKAEEKDACTTIKDASYPAPFEPRLEYGCPARGSWNIVHVGMLIPQSHQIYVCGQGCLRGVVLTAAEMNAADRFSTIAIRENNVLEGDMEDLIVDGISDIIGKLKYTPRAILVFTSCIHHFIGCDLPLVYKRLREKFPNIDFTDCYMNPIMRKSGLTPDQLMRKQLYSLLKPRKINNKSINIIGNNFPTDESSELVQLIRNHGYQLKDITLTKTYEEYQEMSESFMNISYNPAVIPGGEYLKEKLNQKYLYLPLSYGYEEIENNLDLLCENLNIEKQDWSNNKLLAEKALKKAKEVINDAPIVIDYTATMRPLSLARLLLEHDFNVTSVYMDAITSDEKDDFEFLKGNYPSLKLYSTIHVKMRVLNRESKEKTLAIGQKAAYFTSSNNFINIVEGGGMYGFDGICKLANLMVDAFENEKDAKKLIQIKGLGCGN